MTPARLFCMCLVSCSGSSCNQNHFVFC
jgi:hypothetical protein